MSVRDMSKAVLDCEFCGCRRKTWKGLPLVGWSCDCCGAWWLQDEVNPGKGCKGKTVFIPMDGWERIDSGSMLGGGKVGVSSGAERACEYCGQPHAGICPKVKAVEYHPNGALKRVEFREDDGRTEQGVTATGVPDQPRGEWQGKWPVRKGN